MKIYTTIQGDMWDAISFKALGSTAYLDRLIEANPAYRSQFVFPAGIDLVIPELLDVRIPSNAPLWKQVQR